MPTLSSDALDYFGGYFEASDLDISSLSFTFNWSPGFVGEAAPMSKINHYFRYGEVVANSTINPGDPYSSSTAIAYVKASLNSGNSVNTAVYEPQGADAVAYPGHLEAESTLAEHTGYHQLIVPGNSTQVSFTIGAYTSTEVFAWCYEGATASTGALTLTTTQVSVKTSAG